MFYADLWLCAYVLRAVRETVTRGIIMNYSDYGNDYYNKKNYNKKLFYIKRYCVVAALFAVNALIFALSFVFGDEIYAAGSLDAAKIIDAHQYYRLVSCMFIHGGIEHIAGNMLFLVALGEMLERSMGHLRFLILYMTSGLGASICSLNFIVLSGSNYTSVGASGAIFGMIGAVLYLTLANNGRYNTISAKRVILAIIYQIYIGLRTPFVDNAAHIGGLIWGVLVMLFLRFFSRNEGYSEN